MNKTLEYIFPEVPADIDISSLDIDRIPEHIAVIMDGNGRWAKKRMLNRLKGHKAGIEAVRETIRCASDLGVRFLTIYSFSTENWKRPEDEVEGLMDLFAKTMLAEVDELHEEHVRVVTIGDMTILPEETRLAFEEAWEKTKNNTGLTLVVAINYGSRAEIVRAANEFMNEKLASIVADGSLGSSGSLASGGLGSDSALASSLDSDAFNPNSFNPAVFNMSEEDLSAHLYTKDMPDPELLIRTSGELRVSNFLLWQIAYSEFVCTDVLWPDFDRYELLRCILEYQNRDRRFGGVA